MRLNLNRGSLTKVRSELKVHGQDADTNWDLVPLSLLRAGQTASVGEVLGSGDLLHRLQEMGLRHGAALEMVRPGSPCIIRLEGQKLCVRSEEMTRILVRMGVATPW